MTDLLVKLILAKDPAAIDLAREIGRPAWETVRPFFSHPDSTVRLIAVHAAHETGFPDLARALVPLLTDEAPSVRTTVLKIIRNRLDSGLYPELLEIFPQVPDADDRRILALIIGRIPEARAEDFRRLRDNESAPAARTGCVVVLAKLGDEPSRTEFLNALHGAEGRSLKEYLDLADYIAQDWLLPTLTRMLDKREPLVFIGSFHGASPGPDYLRACDLAVDLIEKITRAGFTFTKGRTVNYSEEQISEVRNFIEG